MDKYIGLTYSQESKYKLDVSIFKDYQEHNQNSTKEFITSFTKGLRIDLDINWEIVGYSQIEMLTYV